MKTTVRREKDIAKESQSKMYKEIFENVQWGTETVLEETIQSIKQLGLSYFLLPELDDIDYPADLKKLDPLPQFNNLLSLID